LTAVCEVGCCVKDVMSDVETCSWQASGPL
jgi:hypothetical protein